MLKRAPAQNADYGVSPDRLDGASAIQCCYAAIGRRLSATLADIIESKNKSLIFCSAKKLIVEEKISLNVRRLVVKPACIAGVRTARPNFSAL